MSIASGITRISKNVEASYAAVNAKGGKLPEQQNSDNLPAAITAIPINGTDFTTDDTLKMSEDNVLSVETPVNSVMSQEDFDKLPPEKKNRGLYVITGRNGGSGSGGSGQSTDSDLYAYALYAYDGVNIKDKFSGEMERTDPWIWVQQRLSAQDLSGLHIKDYFEVTAGGNLLQMQIADVNHDLHFGDTEITKYHIDFISKDLWPTEHQWNKKNYNNGLASEPGPWLCSDLYAWLNSKSMSVPNAETANPSTIAVNYTSTGVYDKLPETLRNVIIERRTLVPTRYNSGNLLTDDAAVAWKNIGKLWVPNETEVYGQIVWGTNNGYSVGETHQFPIFTDGKMRIKCIGNGGSRGTWWLRSVASGDSTGATYVNNAGVAYRNIASTTGLCAPVCFRISA